MFSGARELGAYQDEPPQLPSGSFGKNAMLRLGFEPGPHRSLLRTLHRRAPLIVQQALYWDEEMPGLPCVSIISNAGGILQGDRNVVEIDMAAGSQAHVTTQSATRIHEMDANYASQTQELTLAAGSYLEYIARPIIPARNSRFIQATKVSIDPTATLIYSEILMPGRKHYGDGEIFQYKLFSSTVEAARPDGTALFAEKFVIEPDVSELSRMGVMGGFHVFGNVIVLTPKENADALFDRVTPAFDADNEIAYGASRLPNDAGIIFKVLAMESAPVMAKIREFWSEAREIAAGHRVPENFLWA
ncbi:urease accessory protein UreD [Kaistia defluvii]|uniref:urease accessory protein UreD n=1 Tax=Kaistia defluvii TaxID=410841 RepID=UPI0022579C3A|nr:urease accessory protein UreD [Kaistia defluvii]MCX5517196.1 urease accessory protein UreD [Kaistia defluvii]